MHLVFRGQGEPYLDDRRLRQNCTIFISKPDVSIRLHKTLKIRRTHFAIRAVVVEEIHECKVTVRISSRWRVWIVHDHVERYLRIIGKRAARQDQQRRRCRDTAQEISNKKSCASMI